MCHRPWGRFGSCRTGAGALDTHRKKHEKSMSRPDRYAGRGYYVNGLEWSEMYFKYNIVTKLIKMTQKMHQNRALKLA